MTSRRQRTSIPQPRPDVHALWQSVIALKDAVEQTNGSRKGVTDEMYVSLRDLLSLGVVVIDENGYQRQLIRGDFEKLRLLDRNSD